MSTENIVKNRYYRILKDKTNAIWDRISFWTHADDVELTGGATLSSDLTAKQTKIDATQNDFAQVESSPTTHAYIRGQMLLYNNQLYRVTQNIAVGATLIVGTNIEAVSVSTLSSMLTATNGNGFYFDVKDGTPGFYPTASKTASEFVPFGGTAITLGEAVHTRNTTVSLSGDVGDYFLIYGYTTAGDLIMITSVTGAEIISNDTGQAGCALVRLTSSSANITSNRFINYRKVVFS